jgi:predicted dehydrogenase
MLTRIGIIGCGAVTEQLHMPALVARRDCLVTALVDRDPRRTAALARLAPDARCGTAVADVIDDFDAAIVALPHHLHASISIELLRAGKKVLVEKPMALTTGECDVMVAAAGADRTALTVGQMRRFLPAVDFARRLIHAGALGEITSVDVRDGVVFDWPVESDFQFRKDRAGGGVLMDTGAHTLDMIIGWFGEPAPRAYQDDAPGGVEADCVAELALASGAPCRVELSRTRTLRNSAIVSGTRGSIEVMFYANRLTATLAGSVAVPFDCVPQPSALPHADIWRHMFDFQLDNWLGAISEGRSAAVPGVEGRKVVRLIESLYGMRQPLDLPWELASRS